MNPFSQKIPPLYSLPLLKGGWGRDFVVGISVLVFFLLPLIGFAQGYVPLAPLPNTVPEPCNPLNPNALKPTDAGYKETCKTGSLPDYLSGLYKLGIGAAGVLAVLMLVWGGFQYTTSEAIQGKSDAKGIIQNVLWGGAIVLGSYLLLFTINPRLVDIGLALQNLQGVNKTRLPQSEDVYGSILKEITETARAGRKDYEKGLQDANAKFAEAKAAEEAGDFEKARELREEGYALERATEVKRQTEAARTAFRAIVEDVATKAKNKELQASGGQITDPIMNAIDAEANKRISDLQKYLKTAAYPAEADAIRKAALDEKARAQKAERYWACYYYGFPEQGKPRGVKLWWSDSDIAQVKAECKHLEYW